MRKNLLALAIASMAVSQGDGLVIKIIENPKPPRPKINKRDVFKNGKKGKNK
ncbi:hypothetical protein [Pasteurella multocida]|uniref:hypothetical protein n=1 Tax=Pasteurella multocida TaxID=747 RepID=UPI001F5367A9|nr:hypothetical protein [Pasteurella multocida]